MDLPFWLECSRTFILRKCRYWLLLSTAIVVKVFLSGASWIKRNPKFFQKSLFTLLCGWFVVTLSSTLIGWLKVNKARLKKCIASMPPREQNQCFLRESEEVIIQLAHSSSSSFDGLFLQLLIMQYHQSLFCYVPLTYYKRATASKSRQDESIGGDKKKGDSLSWSSLMMSLCRLQHGHPLAKSARLTPPFPIPSIFSP